MFARILEIEYDPMNMELMVYLLKAYGYEPLHARNGREGIDTGTVKDFLKPDLTAISANQLTP